MYSARIIQRNIEKVEASTGRKLHRYDVGDSLDLKERLSKLKTQGEKFSQAQRDFIWNERVLSQLDFEYWAERYHTMAWDGVEGGGVGPLRIWESQRILLNLIAKVQEEQYDQWERGETVDGILIADHKARQIGHTALARALMIHRVAMRKHQRCACGSVDDPKIHELYERDKISYESLPFYLIPTVEFVEKHAHVSFMETKAKIVYMISTMKSSFGQSMQFDFAHMTEVSEWPYPKILEVDFFPTLPQSPDTLCILESRANGRGNWWHDFSENVRRGRMKRWRYCFVPWYAEPKKYRRTAPADWQPSEVALLHAAKVRETSLEFVGKTVDLGREQLYWWETTREEYKASGSLFIFLTNYCATPEESFQFSGSGAFTVEVLERLRLEATGGIPYEFERTAA